MRRERGAATFASIAGGGPAVSVLMPTYDQASFIRRAIDSLLAQSFTSWELIVVDDASPDETERAVAPYLDDARIRYVSLQRNVGLGAALNHASDLARAPLIAYLPSDDVYHGEHLASLVEALETQPAATVAYSGVRYRYNREAAGHIYGEPLQLVQVMHRATSERWTERTELVTDDLAAMFWSKLGDEASFVATGAVSCEWVDHPAQRHKIIREPLGGVNVYRSRYAVSHPLRFHSTAGNRIDEVEHYRRFRERPPTPPAPDGLKILLCGELAYNPERILALEERGHDLYGLWTPEPTWFNGVGPLPFGHVQDLPRDDWRSAASTIKPDVIYALLNWQAVPFIHRVMRENPGIPFVFHFKEGPMICIEKGMWPKLVEICSGADGLIFSTPEMQAWFETAIPGTADVPRHVLDGDLPSRVWFTDERSRRLSEDDGEIHTVVPGRPIGLHPESVRDLAAEGIHLHFYGDFTQGQWRGWIERAMQYAGGRLHLHPNVDQEDWVREFSRYDAGWLHVFESANGGDLRRAIWDDLNYPARIATVISAGLPLIQYDNRGHIVATQALARAHGTGMFFRTMAELASQLADEQRMSELRRNVWRRRDEFTFDHHADELLAFFRSIIEGRATRASTASAG